MNRTTAHNGEFASPSAAPGGAERAKPRFGIPVVPGAGGEAGRSPTAAGRRSSRAFVAVPGIIVIAMMVTGCAGPRATHQAHRLPTSLQAAPLRSVADVDLSRLARTSDTTEIIQAGDTVEVALATGLEEIDPPPRAVRVGDNGAAVLPLVGPVDLAGRRLPDAEAAIYHASVKRGIYRNPQVSVFLKERRVAKVTVTGAVKEPGLKDIPANNCDLATALVAAGGLAEHADTTVEIRYPPGTTALPGQPETPNPNAHSVRLDLLTLAQAADGDYRLPDGAVVDVAERKPRVVSVMGLVRKPGTIEMPVDKDLHLVEAIAHAGGRELQVADKIHILRTSAEEGRSVLIRASFKEAKERGKGNIRLMPGDVITVEETPVTFTLATLRNLLRVGVSPALN